MSFVAPALASLGIGGAAAAGGTAAAAGGIGLAGLSQIGTAISTVGSVVGTVSALSSLSYQQEVARRNAETAEQNARKAMENSQREGQDWGLAASQELAAMEAEGSASGISTAQGTPYLAFRAKRRLARRDGERIAEEGRTRAEGFRQQKADMLNATDSAAAERRATSTAGIFNLGSTLIGGSMTTKKIKMGVY